MSSSDIPSTAGDGQLADDAQREGPGNRVGRFAQHRMMIFWLVVVIVAVAFGLMLLLTWAGGGGEVFGE